MHPIAITRQTEFDICDIVSHLSQNTISEKLLVNELGVIFLDTAQAKEKRRLAENMLVNGLQSSNADVQFISYCQLRRANGTASEHAHRAIDQFLLIPANHKMIGIAQETLWL